MWMNKDESWNFPQDYDPELIKEEKRKELETEIRVQVCQRLPPVRGLGWGAVCCNDYTLHSFQTDEQAKTLPQGHTRQVKVP